MTDKLRNNAKKINFLMPASFHGVFILYDLGESITDLLFSKENKMLYFFRKAVQSVLVVANLTTGFSSSK